MSKRKPAKAASTEDSWPPKPDWFDEARHRITEAGIRDRVSGHFLAADGLPVSGPARAAALAAAGKAEDVHGHVSADAIAAFGEAPEECGQTQSTDGGSAAGDGEDAS